MKQSFSQAKGFLLTAIILVGILTVAFASWSCKGGSSGKTESIAMGMLPAEAWALVYVADEKKFFKDNGLDVIMKSYETAVAAINGMIKGEVDLAPTSEFVFVGKAFQKENISIIGSIVKADAWHIIGRKDHGIKDIADLKGKRIGLPRGGIGEFYLGRFLDLHGLNIADVTLIHTKPSELPDAIGKGSVDAVIVWLLYVNQIKERLVNGAVMWPAQGNQAGYGVISGRNDWITGYPERVRRVLSSFSRAEEYVIQHPTQAKAILQKRLQVDAAFVEHFWPHNRYSLSLDHSLIVAMRDEARWMIKNSLTTEKQVPDFLDHIYADGLKAVKPGAVDIAR
jgi:ABC-type nitrate/sulfonate/bicarbonate transport system substrate-binding protein